MAPDRAEEPRRRRVSDAQPATAPLARIDYLDGWRGLAISLVLAAHFAGVNSVDAGRFGVDVFFVLSGLLMSRILFVERTPLSLFYKRRISRILPVFLLFAAVVYVGGYLRDRHFTGEEVLSTVAFLRTYLPVAPSIWDADVPVGHLWSLNVEEHCYVVLSLLAACIVSVRRNALALFTVAFVTLVAWLCYVRMADAPKNFELRTECAATCLMLSAGYYLVRDRFAGYVQGWMPPAALLLAALCYSRLAIVPWWSSALVAPFCLAFAVNHLGRSARPFLAVFHWAPLRMLGTWSYSIYLWQQPFYEATKAVAPGDSQHGIPTGLALVAAMAVSLVSFYCFERPTRTWLNARLGSYPGR